MTDKNAEVDKIPIAVLTNAPTPFKGMQLLMLYKAVEMAQLAYMDGLNPDTGETEAVLVGLEPTEDGKFQVCPLAKLFTSVDDIPKYLVPDGQGGFLDDSADDTLATIPEEEGPSSEG